MTVYDIEFISNIENTMDISNPVFSKFVMEYEKIIKSETAIPIFNNHTKFHSNKNKKNSKKKYNTQCIFIRNSNAWTPNAKVELEKEITNSIISNLNKLSSINFNIITDSLIKDIHSCNTPNITNILCNEIITKNIYDKDYQDEYVKLCIRICNENFTPNNTIIKSDNKYYWEKNGKYVGPYNTLEDVEEYYNNILSFKRILLNKLYERFMNRYNVYNDMLKEDDDDKRFKLKREIISIIEFSAKLYNNNVISFNIIYLIHMNLFDINKSPEHINLDLEMLYIMWGVLFKVPYNKIGSNQCQINIIFNYINNVFSKMEFSYRIGFFIEDLIENMTKKFRSFIVKKDVDMVDDACDECIIDMEEELNKHIKDKTLYNFVIKRGDEISDCLDLLVYIVLNNSKHNDIIVDCIKRCFSNSYINEECISSLLSHTEEDIREMELDNYAVRTNYNIMCDIFRKEFEFFI